MFSFLNRRSGSRYSARIRIGLASEVSRKSRSWYASGCSFMLEKLYHFQVRRRRADAWSDESHYPFGVCLCRARGDLRSTSALRTGKAESGWMAVAAGCQHVQESADRGREGPRVGKSAVQ